MVILGLSCKELDQKLSTGDDPTEGGTPKVLASRAIQIVLSTFNQQLHR